MKRTTRTWRDRRPAPLALTLVSVLVAVLVAAAAACGNSAGQDNRLALVVDTFGTFGYRNLLNEYEKLHPEIKITERVREFNEHHRILTENLDKGSGAGDIVAIEEAYVVEFRNRVKDFQNLFDYGAASLASNWLPWKWQETLANNGTFQVGLGTDVGGLALCFRPDLFRAAGLPTDRDQVAAMWNTWEDYVALGKRFNAANLPAQWTDSATTIYNQVLAQQQIGYFDTNNTFVAQTSPGVRRAWDVSMAIVQSGESAKYVPFNTQWVAALQGGRFATLACPAWILGWIQQNAPSTRGAWDVARVPDGAGNWGGSWLAVPKQSKHPAEAYQLASWLTAAPQQLRIFHETGNLPSMPQLYTDPAVATFTSAFFRDAPVGKIFTSAVQLKPPQYLGRKTAPVRKVFEHNIGKVEVGSLTQPQAWNASITESEQVIGR